LLACFLPLQILSRSLCFIFILCKCDCLFICMSLSLCISLSIPLSTYFSLDSFIHSQALIVQDGPLAPLSGFPDHTHGRTPQDEWSARLRFLSRYQYLFLQTTAHQKWQEVTATHTCYKYEINNKLHTYIFITFLGSIN
jgi:hypothetical protein